MAEYSAEQPKRGMLVEDTSVAGGVDVTTGATVVRPKTVGGRVDEATSPTDRREAPDKRGRNCASGNCKPRS